MFGAVSGAWAQLTNDDIEVEVKPSATGTVTKNVNSETRVVTLTVTPASNYYIKASDIIVEKLVDPGKVNAPKRRISGITDVIVGKMYKSDMSKEITSVEAGSSAKYVFTVPADYDGVYVTATFHLLTEDNIIKITSSTNLGNSPDMTVHYILVEDVSASVVEKFYSSTAFTGIFEGEAQTNGSFPKIIGLEHALFRTIDGGTVKNITLDNVGINITTNNTNVGAIANEATGAARIYNCGILSGSVGGKKYTGGVVGLLDGTARVINCYSYAKITGGSDVGGIVGYNNVASSQSNVATMVMNCLFYGDITGGSTVSPVYGGNNINNLNPGGLATYNYYAYSQLKSKAISKDKYNCAMAMEERFLNQCELYRLLMNSNKKLAAIYATGDAADADKMAKWVLETADRTIETPKPYPILKAQGYYPSIINYDAKHAPDSASVGRLNGGRIGRALTVTISGVGSNHPSGASIRKSYLTLQRTDKDTLRNNFNYDKIQLPYYNDVGEGNYTEYRVVTGWKITSVSGGTEGSFTEEDAWGGYNFADRKCTKKDIYYDSGRVFSQGAYYDVPYGVTAITIEPYWGQAAYVSDQYYDVVYKAASDNKSDYESQNVEDLGTQNTNNSDIDIFGDGNMQKVFTSIEDARASLEIPTSGKTVYDYAVVLVGNVHQAGPLFGYLDDPRNKTQDKTPYKTPYTIMSVDLDKDNEPDYSFIFSHYNRQSVSPIRFDFLNVPGTAQAQKPNGTSQLLNVSIFNPLGWFEITNTCSVYITQFEADNGDKEAVPVILLGGMIDQYTSTQQYNISSNSYNHRTSYIHLGSNACFKEFGNGTHSDGYYFTNHVPVSVTGGSFNGFYLSGVYRPDAQIQNDDAEGYISGGYFKEMAGAAQQIISGSVHWQIYDADINNFYGGGINADKPILGDVTVDIINSHVGTYCGGPKFGDMQKEGTTFTTKYSNNKAGTSVGTMNISIDKDGIVTTNATGCTFNKFFGAGYGGASSFKLKFYDATGPNFNNLITNYNNDRGKYFDGLSSDYKSTYGNKGPGIATDFDYEFFVWSSGSVGARFYVNYTIFSLAQTNNVYSTLTDCIIEENFYGGGSYGKVAGTATSELKDCTVKNDVFGGGYSASIPSVYVRETGFDVVPKFNKDSGIFEMGKKNGTKEYTWTEGTLPDPDNYALDDGKFEIPTDLALNGLGQVVNTNLTISGSTTVKGSVYGGGALASMDESGETKVNLIGGTINGDVYGGAQGRLAGTKDEHGNDLDEVKALVGSANVKLNGLDAVDYKAKYTNLVREGENGPYVVKSNEKGCVVKGSIFGCNNLNGTPKGTATVHVYSTQNAAATTIGNPSEGEKTAKVAGRYDVKAVYGGGNLAAYEPAGGKNTTNSTNVIIDGCGLTSIQTVYGGGNAASTPATKVTVNGTFEIEEVFGGGNGKDAIGKDTQGNDIPNPGANVGFYDYSAVESTYDTKEKRQQDNFVNNYVYGSGKASVNIFGGTIHRVFGGSNTKGNVRQTALTLLDENSGCDFCVDEAYGGGKSAPMDAEAKLLMACIPGLKAAYGGAEAADIQGNVTLNITNGTFDRVFGGNNISGTINGAIAVNIEEVGCKPIIIGELYGGGNRAGYSIYGYKEVNVGTQLEPNYVWRPRESADDEGTGPDTPYEHPQVNVKSFTSIGTVYGGGYGSTAVMVGNPTVNISEVVGTPTTYPTTGDFDETGYKGDTKEIDGYEVTLPAHVRGKMGAINNVFGGGNAAKVIGNTNVSIGTLSEVYVVKTVTTGAALPAGCYTRNNDGTYTAATGTAVDGMTYYEKKTVLGADIRGNVYGGGNNAEVTGNTNVNIGKQNN